MSTHSARGPRRPQRRQRVSYAAPLLTIAGLLAVGLAVGGIAALGAGADAGARGESVDGGGVEIAPQQQAEPAAGGTGASGAGTGGAGMGAAGTGATSAVRPLAEVADPAWVARIAAASDIPTRALAAYGGAELRLAVERPGCHLSWTTLAAIGRVESDHGRYGGGGLDAAGVASPAIVGVALAGGDTLRVRDTDGGALDGDAVWDRAVGPMQFIPSTWASAGRDGNGDGVANPQQIDDAVLAAAHYLCDAGGDLSQSANWIRAVAAYNPNIAYNNRVADAANAYAAAGR